MERDFMGLISEEVLASIKQELPDQDPETQSPFNKNAIPSHPHFMSFMSGASQGDEMKKMVSDPITSSACVASSPADAFHLDQETSVDEHQKSPLSLSYCENCGIPTTTRQQFLGVPMTVTSPACANAGFTNPGNNNKLPAGPAQMTIFYAGTVNVYDKISPEMAKAIMLLAGTSSSLASSNMTPSPAEVAVLPNRPLSFQPGSNLKTQLDFSSTRKDDEVETKIAGVSSSLVCNRVPQSVVSSSPVPTLSAIPLSRRASLARFFERRKERVMSSGPYSCDKKPQEGVVQRNNI